MISVLFTLPNDQELLHSIFVSTVPYQILSIFYNNRAVAYITVTAKIMISEKTEVLVSFREFSRLRT